MTRIGRHRTQVYKDGDWLICKYWNTEIVKYNVKNNEVVLQTDGWDTITSRNRIIQCSNEWQLGFRLTTHNSRWYVIKGDKSYAFEDNKPLSKLTEAAPLTPAARRYIQNTWKDQKTVNELNKHTLTCRELKGVKKLCDTGYNISEAIDIIRNGKELDKVI